MVVEKTSVKKEEKRQEGKGEEKGEEKGEGKGEEKGEEWKGKEKPFRRGGLFAGRFKNSQLFL